MGKTGMGAHCDTCATIPMPDHTRMRVHWAPWERATRRTTDWSFLGSPQVSKTISSTRAIFGRPNSTTCRRQSSIFGRRDRGRIFQGRSTKVGGRYDAGGCSKHQKPDNCQHASPAVPQCGFRSIALAHQRADRRPMSVGGGNKNRPGRLGPVISQARR